jgi:hypothetical protein
MSNSRARQSQRQQRLEVAHVITAMSRGASLQLAFTKRGSAFVLSDGTPVAYEIAVMVINDLRIVSNSDGLFPALPQSWSYQEPRSF